MRGATPLAVGEETEELGFKTIEKQELADENEAIIGKLEERIRERRIEKESFLAAIGDAEAERCLLGIMEEMMWFVDVAVHLE